VAGGTLAAIPMIACRRDSMAHESETSDSSLTEASKPILTEDDFE